MDVLQVVLTGLGLVALALGLIGLAAGGLDALVFRTRPRLTLLTAVGLGLLFLGAAPPTRVAAGEQDFPDPSPPVPVRRALGQMEQSPPPAAPAAAVFPEQTEAFRQWENSLLAAYEAAEQALGAVPAVLEGLAAGRLDRFTAWVHLGRYSQDVKQAHLALHDLTPPSILNLEHQHQLKDALKDLHHSLANQRAAVIHLQRHARTLNPRDLEAAQQFLVQGRVQRQRGLERLVRVKVQLGLGASSPAPASAAGPPAGR